MLRTTRCIKLTAFFALAVLLAAPLYAAPATGGVADVVLGTTQVDWVPNSPMVSYSLIVSGPDGVVERNFEAGETPTFNLAALAGDVDGSYSWQLTATPELSAESRRLMAEARAAGTTFTPKDLPSRNQLIESGHFRVMDGTIVQPSATPEPELGIATGGETQGHVSDGVQFMAEAQTFPTDVEIQGSLCVGLDCASGESFGFDTIRLKENNLRIKFQDTSNSGSFPTTDWQITINDSANGGASYYRIEDITNSKVPFTIEANTPNDTLYVDSTGRVGIGTSLPVVEAHVADGDTPTLRLEQNTSSGFGAQTWDVAGNEANFFVRDVTNGSQLPFRIKPGAPSSSVFIAADGNVGFGTETPDFDIDIDRSTSSAANFVVRGTSGSMILQDNDATSAEQAAQVFSSGGAFRIRGLNDALAGETVPGIALDLGSGDVSVGCSQNLAADFTVGTASDCSGTYSRINAGESSFTVSSSRSIKKNLKPVEVQDILDRLVNIEVYEYDFTEGPENRIGLMAEDFHQVFQRGSDKLLSGQEVQMALWLAVRELARQNRDMQEENNELTQKLDQLQEVLTQH